MQLASDLGFAVMAVQLFLGTCVVVGAAWKLRRQWRKDHRPTVKLVGSVFEPETLKAKGIQYLGGQPEER